MKTPFIYSCPTIRRKLRHRSAFDLDTNRETDLGSEWVTEPCDTPLFTADQESGVCRSCRNGWVHPHNYPADQPQPTQEAWQAK